MRRIIATMALSMLAIFISGCSDDDAGNNNPNSNHLTILTNGRMLTVQSFPSTILGNSRNIRIYLPASYGIGAQSYPVLYMHDGQNVFSPGGPYGCWNVESAYNSLVAQDRINEVILIGVNNNNDRIPEYTPTADPSHGGGNGANYLRFLVEELVPYVSSNFRTKTGPTNTAIMGSSLGGLISFYAGITRPEVFGMVACMSSSFWWDSQKLLSDFESSSGPASTVKFWIDSGNAEGGDPDKNGVSSMAEDAIRAAAKLRQLGYAYGQDLMLDIDIAAGHNEAAWAGRVHNPLLFFFGKNPVSSATNLQVTPSSPEMDVSGVVPEILLFTRVWFDTGISATIPPKDVQITSEQAGLFSIQDTGFIVLQGGAVSEATNIDFTASYLGQTNTASVEVYLTLSPTVLLQLEVTAPETAGESIIMVGNNASIGSWDPTSGLSLSLHTSGGGNKVYTNSITLPRNTSMEFKFCSGPAWSYEELTASGSPIDNRNTTVNSSSNWYSGTVAKWKAVP